MGLGSALRKTMVSVGWSHEASNSRLMIILETTLWTSFLLISNMAQSWARDSDSYCFEKANKYVRSPSNLIFEASISLMPSADPSPGTKFQTSKLVHKSTQVFQSPFERATEARMTWSRVCSGGPVKTWWL